MPDDARAQSGGLRGYYVQSPPTWGALPLERSRGLGGKRVRRALADLAADLTTGPEGASHCEQQLLFAHDALIEEPHLGVAVWVPDPVSGLICGTLVVDHLVHDEDDGVARPDRFESELRATAEKRTDLVRIDISRSRLSAGEVVLTRSLAVAPDDKLDERVTYTVFPDACRDAIQLDFSTPDLHLFEALAAEAELIAHSLTAAGHEL